jgi:hypothetical protein
LWSAKTTFRHLSPCSRTVHKRFRMFGIPEGPNFCGAHRLVPVPIFYLLRIGQYDGNLILQDIENRNPVGTRALHRHVCYAFRIQPFA